MIYLSTWKYMYIAKYVYRELQQLTNPNTRFLKEKIHEIGD